VTRRRLLLAAAALLAGLVAALGRRRLGPPRAPAAQPAAAPAAAASGAVVPSEDEPLLLRIADVIVPADGDSPPASGIDLLPRLERWIGSSSGRRAIYERGWPALALRVRELGPEPGAAALAALCGELHGSFRAGAGDAAAGFFEQLRRDVLRVYWASPAGWAAVGYTGPAHRAHPEHAAP
jgi:hypothetical protein